MESALCSPSKPQPEMIGGLARGSRRRSWGPGPFPPMGRVRPGLCSPWNWGSGESGCCLGWGLGLAKSSSLRAQEVAFQLAQNWIRTNFDVYSQTSAMYEKYDISNGGQPGGGGEYEVQEGFGWTNGEVLMLLDCYGDRLTSGAQLAFLEPRCLVAALLLNFLVSLLPR
ncbi:trehalase [Eulemur rufifrons]|uniref:trehalase n=1 Tax=Eulemur rufifrons TaxID=859984 RepID=UPI0037430EF5